MNSKKHSFSRIIIVLLLIGAGIAGAQQQSDSQRQQLRQAPAVSKSVFEKLQESQDLLNSDDAAGALRLLTSLVEKKKLSEYEKSNVLQYIGYAHNSVGDTASAIRAFGQVLKIPSLEDQVRKNTLYTLAQLSTANDEYVNALRFLEEWFDLELNPAPEPHILHAQILYQLDRYPDMVSPVEKALAVAEARSIEVKENWFALLSFAYFQLEDYSKIRDINKTLLESWPRKRYWLYLANAYRELGDDANMFAAYDVAHLQGMMETEVELVMMAQLHLQEQVPFKAAQLLEVKMNGGQIERSAENYRLLSQAWISAQEYERSLKPLEYAAQMSEDGNLYVKLANAQLSLGQYENCASSIRAGFSKGQIKNFDHAQISLGMCRYNLRDYQAAIRAFREARRSRRSARTANQWIGVLTSEVQRTEQISAIETLVRKRRRALADRRAAGDRT